MKLTAGETEAFVAFETSGWERAAEAYHDHWGALSSQSATAMLDAAGVGPGSLVLDVATGAGYVAAAAHDRGARALGLDFSAAQVALAARTYPQIQFLRGDAANLPLDDGSLDAVVMGFGMNHLPDPEAAAAEAWRVLKPGGRFAFTVWAAPGPADAFGIVLTAIEANSVPDPDLPPAPPYFRLADAREAAALLMRAGFVRPATSIVAQTWRHRSPDQVFDAFNEGAVRATAMLRSQPEDVRRIIRRDVRAAVSQLAVGDEFHVPVPAALSVGHKAA